MATALIAFFSATLAILANFGMEWYRRNQRARSIAAMIAAEITTQVKITEIRNYIEHFDEVVKLLEKGSKEQFSNFIFMEPNDNPIFDLVKSEVGLLGPELATNVVQYYSHANSIRGDIKYYSDTELEISHLPIIKADIELWKDTAKSGKNTADQLFKRSKKWLF